jgi:hypothetical protein
MKKLLFTIAAVIAVFYWLNQAPVEVPPGQVAPGLPVQRDLAAASPITHNGYTLTPLAEFEIEARVLASERYRIGREAELSPVDLALGWGPMSDSSVLEHVDIRQSGRFYYWRVEQFPIPRREIETHSANMHMIPADEQVADVLLDVRPGQVVDIEGYLVRADASDGWRWISSLTRNDTGNGACELIWVERASLR